MTLPSLTPMAHLINSQKGLQAGHHMRYIGNALVQMAESNPERAQSLVSSIMAGSSERDPKLEKAAIQLAATPGKRQRYVAASLIKYRELPESMDADELSENFDLMGDSALDVLVEMSSQYNEEHEDINEVTDSILNLGVDEQRNLASELIRGQNSQGVISHFFPLGLELE